MDAATRAVADELAIQRVLARYAHGVDRGDLALVASCYHPDALEDRGPRYRGGLDGFLPWLGAALAELESCWHLMGLPLIVLEGDAATVETHCLAVHRRRPSPDGPVAERTIPLRYRDRFERRDGDWRIARRVAVYDAPAP